jgi:hypothetical protein
MTTTEAQALIAELTADFLANPYNLVRDLVMNHEGDDEFDTALEVLGSDWENSVSWQVTASCGEAKATA